MIALPSITNLIPEDYCEYAYITEILQHLTGLDAYRIIALSIYHEIPAVGPDVLVLNTSNELHKPLPYLEQVRTVWSCYMRQETDRLHALPLGPAGDIPALHLKPPQQRQYDVFYAGQLLPRRPYFATLEQQLRRANISADITFTRQFRGGLPKLEYAQRMMNARVALCPGGLAPETFRHYEAARSGCALVSTPLPRTSIYEGAPIYSIPLPGRHEQVGEELIETIRAALREIETGHQRTLHWWDAVWSPSAVAQRIRESL